MERTVLVWSNFPDTSPSFPMLASADALKNSDVSSYGVGTSFEIEEKEVGFIEGVQNVWTFIEDVRERSLFHAIYDDSFFNVMKGFFKNLFHDIGVFLLQNGDIFFLAPAIFLMFMTFIGGRNKYTKWIIPLWFAFFVTTVFHKILA